MKPHHLPFAFPAALVLALWAGAAPAYSAPAGPKCSAAALACISATGTGSRVQTGVPITFGQVFAPGEIMPGGNLAAEDGQGHALPLQIDDVATHPDGSMSFGVLSTILPELKQGAPVIVNLDRAAAPSPAASASPSVAALLATGYDLKVQITLHTPQISRIVFGNRDGTTPGIPFKAGEIVTVILGPLPGDRYSVTVGPGMAGGDFTSLTRLAEAMEARIDEGKDFRAYKLGEGGGYEDLWITSRSISGPAFPVAFAYSGQAHLAVESVEAWMPASQYEAAARPLLQATSNPKTWLRGPVATEFTLVSPLRDVATGSAHPQLTARFDVRLYAGGQIRTDVVMENDWAYEPHPGNLIYDASIIENGRPVYQALGIGHNHHARWHKVVWWKAAPTVDIRYRVSDLFASRMMPNYDSSVRIPESVLAAEAARLAAANTAPMGPAFITPYMPTTGGRDDIAPLPRWTVLFLLSQDPRARAAMLANADAAGAVPIHYRDRPTDEPVSLDDHPGIALMFGKGQGRDVLPDLVNGDTIWTPDAAHQPSLAYIPYLITGDRFYLDEILFWADWDMEGVDPSYRGGSQGLVFPNQIRAQAWSLRALGEAARALPDNDPMKGYFTRKLAGNLKWYVDHYPRNSDRQTASALGWVERPDVPGSTAPWQDDFLALAVGQLAEDGNPLAAEFFRWQARFTVGRWTHQAQGYCRSQAPSYYIEVRDKSGSAIQDWAALTRANWPDQRTCPAAFPEGSYPGSPSGYVANSAAMLAVSAGLGIDGAGEAYRRLRSESPALTAGYADDPSWAIVPRTGAVSP